jgi:hypothetical protein
MKNFPERFLIGIVGYQYHFNRHKPKSACSPARDRAGIAARIQRSPQVPHSGDQIRSNVMRSICVLCVAIGVSLSATAASARGGMGGMGPAHESVTGGAFGTSPASPGTNSLGTALSSTGAGHVMNGPSLGTSPDIDREEVKVEKMIGSICRGC